MYLYSYMLNMYLCIHASMHACMYTLGVVAYFTVLFLHCITIYSCSDSFYF